MIQKSGIEFAIDRSKLEGVKNMDNPVFPSHFLCLICGKPGSGKTSLLKFILKSEQLLFKRYDFIFIITPSAVEFRSLFLPKSNFWGALDFGWITEKVEMINKMYPNEYTNVLFILDDVIAELYKNSRSEDILKFIFNRRHSLKNGMISIIVTSQKYIFAPTAIRSNINVFICFKLQKMDFIQIQKEIIHGDADFDEVQNFVFQEPDDFMVYRGDNNSYFKRFDKILI